MGLVMGVQLLPQTKYIYIYIKISKTCFKRVYFFLEKRKKKEKKKRRRRKNGTRLFLLLS